MTTTEKIASVFWLLIALVFFYSYAVAADWVYRHVNYWQDLAISIVFLGFFAWLNRKLH